MDSGFSTILSCYNTTVTIGTGRLIVAIVTTMAQEAAIALIVLLGLPRAGVIVPLQGLIAILVVWGTMATLLYRAGSRALIRKPFPGLYRMVDCKGKVVSTLSPQGVVKVKGELWDAVSSDGRKINTGERVIVVGQDGLKLTVRRLQSKK